MIIYLKDYKKLLELQKNNDKQIKEKKLLIEDNCQKWIDVKKFEENLNKELSTLNKKYNDTIEEKENNLLIGIGTSLVIFIIAIIIFSINKPIYALLGPLMTIIISSSIYLITFNIIKRTSILEKKISKNENIRNLLQLINNKEKELTNTKELIEKYSQAIIKHRAELKKLTAKKDYINESINELMRTYATPIFEEQLKNIKESKNPEPKTKAKKKNQ